MQKEGLGVSVSRVSEFSGLGCKICGLGFRVFLV